MGGTLNMNGSSSLHVGRELTVSEATATAISSLEMDNGAVLTLGNHNIDLTTFGLTVNGDATLTANLVIAGGTISFANGAVLTMGCSVEIGHKDIVTVELTDEMLKTLDSGGNVDLFASVERALLGQNVTFTRAGADPSALAGTYSLVYDAGTKNISVAAVPEPATGTLSLLALAGLCARRRRK